MLYYNKKKLVNCNLQIHPLCGGCAKMRNPLKSYRFILSQADTKENS